MIIAIIYFYFSQTSAPPKLPDEEVPLNDSIKNDSGIEKPAKNLTSNPVGSGGGGGSGSSGGDGTNPPVVDNSWGKRNLGEVGTEGNESATPNLPSLKYSYKKFIDFLKGLFS